MMSDDVKKILLGSSIVLVSIFCQFVMFYLGKILFG